MIPEFGTREEGVPYAPRRGAYCVLFDALGQIAAVEVRGKYLLPGGGIEGDESAIVALEREFREETGLVPLKVKSMGQSGEYMKSLDGVRSEYVHAHLYYATDHRVIGPPSEKDHTLVWLNQPGASAAMFRPGQRWAVAEAIRLREQGSTG
jgi:8-oxo-dGTP diphosphatase